MLVICCVRIVNLLPLLHSAFFLGTGSSESVVCCMSLFVCMWQVSTRRKPSGIVWQYSDLYWETSLHRTSDAG